VAVRAEHPEVLQAVVFGVAVGVVDLDGERHAPPFREPADLAAVGKNSGAEKTPLKV
jgi:hypothetical protein